MCLNLNGSKGSNIQARFNRSTQISPKLYDIRIFEGTFQIKLVLFQGGRLMTTTRLVQVEGFSRSQGDLWFLKWNYTLFFIHRSGCSI